MKQVDKLKRKVRYYGWYDMITNDRLQLEKYKEDGEAYSRRIEKRAASLLEIENVTSPKAPEFVSWTKTRLDRVVVDYLLREGMTETARKVANHGGIEV